MLFLFQPGPDEAADDLRFWTQKARASGANEWHVHLLAETPEDRALVLRDLSPARRARRLIFSGRAIVARAFIWLRMTARSQGAARRRRKVDEPSTPLFPAGVRIFSWLVTAVPSSSASFCCSVSQSANSGFIRPIASAITCTSARSAAFRSPTLCQSSDIGGFPFRLKVSCDGFAAPVRIGGENVFFGAEEAHGVASLFSPNHIQLAFSSPLVARKADGSPLAKLRHDGMVLDIAWSLSGLSQARLDMKSLDWRPESPQAGVAFNVQNLTATRRSVRPGRERLAL